MNSKDLLKSKHALEVQKELVELKIIPEDSELLCYQQLPGGADTTILEVSFQNHSTKFIQRVFRPGASNKAAEFEYTVQKTLYEN